MLQLVPIACRNLVDFLAFALHHLSAIQRKQFKKPILDTVYPTQLSVALLAPPSRYSVHNRFPHVLLQIRAPCHLLS